MAHHHLNDALGLSRRAGNGGPWRGQRIQLTHRMQHNAVLALMFVHPCQIRIIDPCFHSPPVEVSMANYLIVSIPYQSRPAEGPHTAHGQLCACIDAFAAFRNRSQLTSLPSRSGQLPTMHASPRLSSGRVRALAVSIEISSEAVLFPPLDLVLLQPRPSLPELKSVTATPLIGSMTCNVKHASALPGFHNSTPSGPTWYNRSN